MPTRQAIAARYPAARMATALNTTPEIAAVAVSSDPKPASWTAADEAECEERRAKTDTALSDAVYEVASKVAVRYAWQDVEDAPQLTRIVVDLAVFELYDDDVPKDMEQRRKAAMRALGEICDGTRVLLDAAGAVLEPTDRILFDEPERVFDRDALHRYLYPSAAGGFDPLPTPGSGSDDSGGDTGGGDRGDMSGGDPVVETGVWLGISEDDAFVPAEFTAAADLVTVPHGLVVPEAGWPDGERRFVAYARAASLGDFSFVHVSSQQIASDVNQILGWEQGGPLDLDGVPHLFLRTRGALNDRTRGLVIEAG